MVFASYPKTASLYAVVATLNAGGVNSSSVVYVGTSTYGCVLEDDHVHQGTEDVVVGLRCDNDWNWIEVVRLRTRRVVPT